jgi:hypothetical protein
VPSSGFLPLSTVLAAFAARVGPLRGPPLSVTPRRFAALFHAARALGSRPAELSLPGEPYPLSRASFFLAGSWSTAADATCSGFRGRFPHRAGLVAARQAGPGARLRSRDCGSLRSLRSHQRRAEARRPYDRSLERRDSPVDAAVTPASKLCSPRESVHILPPPWPGDGRRSVLSWAGSPLEHAPARSWVRSVAAHVVRADARVRRGTGRSALARVARTALRLRGLEPGIRRPGGSRTTLANRQAATRRSPRSRRAGSLVASRTNHPGKG